MARYTGAVCRLCRREGQKLFLKGERCYIGEVLRRPPLLRPWPAWPGAARKTSEYGLQLRTKQHAKRYYGVLENQFRHYFEMAEKMQGVTGENLLRLLESRLDNVIYRFGFASSAPRRAPAGGSRPLHRQRPQGQYPFLPGEGRTGYRRRSTGQPSAGQNQRRSSKPTRAVRFRSGWISIGKPSRRKWLRLPGARTLISPSKKP